MHWKTSRINLHVFGGGNSHSLLVLGSKCKTQTFSIVLSVLFGFSIENGFRNTPECFTDTWRFGFWIGGGGLLGNVPVLIRLPSGWKLYFGIQQIPPELLLEAFLRVTKRAWVVAHVFNCKGMWVSVSSKPVWSTEQVTEQPELLHIVSTSPPHKLKNEFNGKWSLERWAPWGAVFIAYSPSLTLTCFSYHSMDPQSHSRGATCKWKESRLISVISMSFSTSMVSTRRKIQRSQFPLGNFGPE